MQDGKLRLGIPGETSARKPALLRVSATGRATIWFLLPDVIPVFHDDRFSSVRRII